MTSCSTLSNYTVITEADVDFQVLGQFSVSTLYPKPIFSYQIIIHCRKCKGLKTYSSTLSYKKNNTFADLHKNIKSSI